MEQSKCGCIASTWYGCIKSGKLDCDEKSSYTEDDGTVVVFKHSCDYEEQPYIDDTNCLYHNQQAALDGLRAAGKSFVQDFETDFCIEGVVVDDPGWRLLSKHYKTINAALAAVKVKK